MIRPLLVLLALAGPAQAVTLDLPGNADVTASQAEDGAARIPVGPYADGRVPVREFPGHVSLQAWSVPGQSTTWQILDPLRQQLLAAGFEVLVDCATFDCGGFDFRFAIRVLPEPAMHVDLGDFRYFAAQKSGPDGTEAVSLLVSRSRLAAFLQIEVVETGAAPPEQGGGSITVQTGDTAAPGPAAPATPGQPPVDQAPFVPGSMAGGLETSGHVVMDDLTFDTGSTELGAGPYASLQELAAYLKDHPDRSVVLVGHTDATGGLEVNIQVSRRRAVSVAQRLVRTYGVPPAQVSADGVGYLAPRATNLTEAGRTLNRRVEAVLTSTE